MKSDKLSKFLAVLALSLFGIVLLILAATAWGIIPLSNFVNYLQDGPAVLRVLIGILFLALAAGVVFVILRVASIGKGPSKGEMNLLSQSNSGSSYITSNAISEMVQRLLKKNEQIKSSNCTVNPVEDGVTVDLKLTAFSGGDLNQLCAAVQNNVKYEIESVTGVPVRNVSVSIIKTIEGAVTKNEVKRVN